MKRITPSLKNKPCICITALALILRLMLVFSITDYEPDSYVRFRIGEQLARNPLAVSLNGVFLPFFQYVGAFVVFLGGSMITVRLLSAVAGALTIPVTYRLSLLVSRSRRIAAFSALLIAVNPFMIIYGSFGVSESIYVLMLLSALYLMASERLATSSIPLALAVLTRYESWVLTPAILLFRLWKDKKISIEKHLPVLASCAAIVGWLWLNKMYYGDAFFFVHHSGAVGFPYSYDVPTVWGVPESVKVVWGLLLYPAIYPFIYVPILSGYALCKAPLLAKNSPSVKFLLFVLLNYTAFLTITQILHISWGWGRHFLPLIPIYTILGCACISTSISKKKLLLTAIVSVSISTVLVYWQVVIESAFLSPT
jgi:4-amino-4-deoxy-L-arabinose transferase-like glycosyltransferase